MSYYKIQEKGQYGYDHADFGRDCSNVPICHYTTLGGFQGIVSSKCLRHSDAYMMNDREEILFGLKIAKNFIDARFKENTIDKNGKERRIKFLDKIRQKLSKRKIFICCFSTEPDSLDMWRTYSKGETGVSIVFKQDFNNYSLYLKSEVSDSGTSQYFSRPYLSKAIYAGYRENGGNSTDEAPDVKFFFENLLDRLDEIENTGTTGNKEKGFFKLITEFYTVKNEAFSSEREVRSLIALNPPYDRRPSEVSEFLNFLPTPYGLKPYLNVYYSQSNSESLEQADMLPIDKIVIGPSSSQEEIARSVSLFLQCQGYEVADEYGEDTPDKVNIEFSSIPFRS